MAHLLSIRTVFPRRDGRVWYEDQREAHRQIYAGDDVVEYAFMGTAPNSSDNRWLRDAVQRQIPVVYFLVTSPQAVPANHPDIHRRVDPGSPSGPACVRSTRGGFGSSRAT
jgi:putative restriction endonuclease